MARCRAITASGKPCRGVPVHGSSWCPAHDPRYAAQRKVGARRGGQAPRASEISEIKVELAELYDGVLGGRVDRGVGAVAAQIEGQRLRALELDHRLREVDEHLRRIEDLEKRMGAYYGAS